MNAEDLKELVDYALDDMPKDCMGDDEREQYRRAMYNKVDSGEIKEPGDVMGEFDHLEQEKGLDDNQP